jgi:chorismate mutase-like protein
MKTLHPQKKGRPQTPGLEQLRRRIDMIDTELLKLINDRAQVVLEVRRLKRSRDIPLYSPERESEIISRLQGHNKGPLSNDAIEELFRHIFTLSIALHDPGAESE